MTDYLKSFRSESTLEERLIATLRKDPELTTSQLCERFGVSPAKVGAVLRKHKLKPGEHYDGIAEWARGKRGAPNPNVKRSRAPTVGELVLLNDFADFGGKQK